MASRKSKAEAEREKVIQNRLQELLTRMLQDEDNKYCVDCDAKGPRWASWNIGIFVCIRCAGIHRNLGVHISKVKSVNLDTWTSIQVSKMQIMGNSKARAVYEANVPEGFRRPQADSPLDVFIRAKYEKKKYIAREWVPTKAPDLPEGWTALIEAEKQKKDIKSIVLPSHTNTDEIIKRERQSPKEGSKKTNSSTTPSAASGSPAVTSATENKKIPAPAAAKPLESEFDLLSLSQQSGQPKTVPTKPAIANDLLCLGGGDNADNSSEFDEFVGAQTANTTTPKAETNTNGNQNGTGSHKIFGDFNIVNTGNETQDAGQENAQKQTMSKDSIMALFNQKPAAAASAVVHPVKTPQQQFPGHFLTGNNTSTMPGMQIPANFGGPQGNGIGGNMGILGGLNQPQPFQQTVGGPGMMNNPFLSMSQPTRSDQNNVFGGFSTTTPGANQNFLQ